MERNRAFYLGLILLLLAIDCSILDFKVTVSAKTGSQDTQSINIKDSNEHGGELSSVSDSNIVVKGNEKHQNQANGSNEKIGGDTKDTNSNSSSSSQSGSKKDDANNNNNSNELNSQSGSKEDDAKNNNNSNELNSQSGSRKTDNLEKGAGDLNKNKKVDDGAGETKNIPELASKDSRFEECDPSNKCTDEKNQLVACLRVSGNDQYSLLVWNKGKSPLSVTISAPDYVQLQKTKIQLQSKEDKEVEVSITHGGSDKLIVLRAGNRHCNLDIKHFITKDLGKELDNSQKSNYINFMSRTPTIVILAFVALVMLAAGWTCISFRRKQHSSSGSKYQKLDMELPVSGGGKAESEQNDGWDDKWGDDWEDEEAPMTPSMPVTPSLSSKGLASRRLSKEGWKD